MKASDIEEFYKILSETPGDYRRAFIQGKLAARLLQTAKWADGSQKPFGLPCFLCRASYGEAPCTRSSIMPTEEEEEERARMERAAAASANDEEDAEESGGKPALEEGESLDVASAHTLSDGDGEQEIAHEEDQEGGGRAARPALVGHGDAGENRSLNNAKGESELAAFKALGFVLDYNRYSIEAGIRKHAEGKLAAGEVGVYGLEEKVQRNGRKLLYLSRAAAKQIFGSSVSGYTDRRLWQKGGAIYRRAEAAELRKVDKAISCLEQSLARRRAGGDAGHDFMRQLIVECVDALKSCAHERRARVSA